MSKQTPAAESIKDLPKEVKMTAKRQSWTSFEKTTLNTIKHRIDAIRLYRKVVVRGSQIAEIGFRATLRR
jgi:hypothetical protein